MADAASTTLHTPWDCRWSRFARRTTREQTRGSLWECVHTGSRAAITDADCASCPLWEYQPTGEGALEQAKACAQCRERPLGAADRGRHPRQPVCDRRHLRCLRLHCPH
jgi:hypothetical protein